MSEPRIALVTGASRGIGREVVRQLAARGWQVFLGARDAAAGARAAAGHVAAAPAPSGTVHAVRLDVNDAASIAAAADAVAGTAGRLDALVNNAGILEPSDNGGSVLALDPDVFRRAFETNVLGALRVTQAFAPLLARSAAARVINVSSGLGALHEMEHAVPAYSVSKTALNALTRQLAGALGPRVAVNAVCPGWVRTDMGGPNAEREVAEGADTIVWLADEAPHDLTGAFLRDRAVIAW